MKTPSIALNSCSRHFSRHASLAATILAASALVFVQPVFAHSFTESAATLSPDDAGTGNAVPPSFEEPWDDASSSFAGPGLAPAPEQPDASLPAPAPMSGGFTPETPTGGPWMESPDAPFAQPFVNLSTTSPMSELPPEGMSHPGFVGPIR
jgi:hypothetical protein